MSVPKIIWCVWCDFNNKKDGIMNEDLVFFKNRIEVLHPSPWKINIITKWDDLMQSINDSPVLVDLMNNPFVGAAHKSDAFRFHILKKYGGFYIDLSTFLVQSMDYLLEDGSDFICFCLPSVDFEEWILSPLGDIYESVSYEERVKFWLNKENKFIKKKEEYNDYNYIPENYFIVCIPNHPIVNITLQMLTDFWTESLPKIKSKEDVCYYQDEYIQNLAQDLFDINNIEISILNTFPKDEKLKQLILKRLWDCGYLFNYLQLFFAMYQYTNGNIKNVEMSEPGFLREKVFLNEEIDSYKNSLCGNNNCNDMIMVLNSGEKIKFLSATFSRLGKWSDNRENRLTGHDTYFDILLDSIKNDVDAENFIQRMKREGFNQIKFSSFGRNSLLIQKLKQWFNKKMGGRSRRR